MSIGNIFLINPIIIYLVIIFVLTIPSIYVYVKKKNKLLGAILPIILFILIAAPPILIFFQFIPEHVSEESMVKSFLINKEKFNTVAQYMVAYGENTHIVHVDDSYKISYFSENFNSQSKDILDEKAKKDIEFILNNLKYKFIYYSGGHVSFARTSDHLARSQKIVYILNEANLKTGENVEIKLIEDGWYYYWGR